VLRQQHLIAIIGHRCMRTCARRLRRRQPVASE
jgi:hypothetical protein